MNHTPLPDWFAPDENPATHPSGAPKFNATDIDAANHAKHEAIRRRGETLANVMNGTLTMWDVIGAAEHDHTLQKITLRTLLRASGRNKTTTDHLMNQLKKTAMTSRTSQPKRFNIGWLYDTKTWPARMVAFAALTPNRTPTPWDGFPYTPPPIDIDNLAERWGVRTHP